MAFLEAAGTRLAYHRSGDGVPVMLIAGLGGTGLGWGEQIDLFAGEFDVLVPDHPGTGGSERPHRYTLAHHAEAMAGLARRLGLGPAHIVGSSTGGAIAQLMALDHPDTVRTITLVSSWARADDFFRHQFAVRKEVLLRQGLDAYARTSALFLFSPRHFRSRYPAVDAFVKGASEGDAGVMADRIDMILEHDTLERLPHIDVPALILVGSEDACTPPHLSEELATHIPNAEHLVVNGGHLIYKEAPGDFHGAVAEFLRRH